MNKKGQVILALILVMTVALAIGLSVIQKSLTDVSTSTKVEQSSRAFSAAEAGIERALQVGSTDIKFPENDSQANVTDTGLVPCLPGFAGCAQESGTQQAALEYPPLSKEEIVHVWFADFNSSSDPPPSLYKPTGNDVDIAWGSSGTATEKTAIEITIVYYNSASTPAKYDTIKKYYDDSSASRVSSNNFEQINCSGTAPLQCKKTITSLPANLILLRARLLYNSISQSFAVQARGTCGRDCSLPPQARVLESVGTSGETERKVRVFQLNKVVPHWFDYAIFSAGEIKK